MSDTEEKKAPEAEEPKAEEEEEKKEEEAPKEEEKKEDEKKEEEAPKEEEEKEEEAPKEEEKKEEAKKEEAAPAEEKGKEPAAVATGVSRVAESGPYSKTGGRGVYWATEPLEELTPLVRESGPGSEPPITVFDVLNNAVTKYGSKVALKVKREGKWQDTTWTQYKESVMAGARALVKLGVERGDGVSILGFNSPEWFIGNMAGIAAGGIAAGIYATNGPEACHYILEHCEASVVFVENEAHCKKILEVRDRLPKLKAIVQWSGKVEEGADVLDWAAFIALGNADDKDDLSKKVDERIASQKPGSCCTLIYTSGTTGNPKAVMISHDNLTWTARSIANILGNTDTDVTVSYLPLSHIAAQMLDLHGPMSVGSQVAFAQPDALKGSLGETLKDIRPTFFLGVPRVWEKMQEKMLSIGKKTTGFKKSIATWAKKKGLEAGYAEQKGGSKPFGFWFANKMVFSKVKAALGLDRCRYQATAAAPITKETLEYFLSLNIPVYEIYGMSECTGPETISLPNAYKTCTCGPAIPGSELVIDQPDKDGNGEIIYRGRHIFMGYMHNEEATSATIDENGFLHSGDVGKVDGNGFLQITGRIKELIITAGGENIPPVLIEDTIKREVPIISNVMIIGDKRKFLSAVITLRSNPDADGVPTKDLTADCQEVLKGAGAEVTTTTDAKDNEKVKEFIQAGIDRANKQAISNAQMVRKFAILEDDFSLPGGELTPTMKLKRRIVSSKYEEVIEGFYA